MYKHLGGGDVGSHGDVMYIAKAKKVGVVGLEISLGKRIAEKEQKIYFITADARGYLLVAALSAAEIFLYLEAGGFGNELSGGGGGTQTVAVEYTAVGNAELYHKLLFRIVCD